MGFLMTSNFNVGKTVTWGEEEKTFSFVANTKLEIMNNSFKNSKISQKKNGKKKWIFIYMKLVIPLVFEVVTFLGESDLFVKLCFISLLLLEPILLFTLFSFIFVDDFDLGGIESTEKGDFDCDVWAPKKKLTQFQNAKKRSIKH